jgi:CTP synthase (UTP-ammonia lyase)
VNPRKIALVGDYSDKVTAHRAIPRALELVRDHLGEEVSWEWIATRDLTAPASDLATFSGLWLVPASPYENAEGAIGAARWAREARRPILGTCGGFQHMLLEFARNVAGIQGAGHAETNPGGSALVVSRLSCSLVEVAGKVRFTPGSLIARAYGAPEAVEGYHCSYGINPEYQGALERAGLAFTSRDDAGDLRAAELPTHPFYVGTLFQPERAALQGKLPPLALAFVRAVARF